MTSKWSLQNRRIIYLDEDYNITYEGPDYTNMVVLDLGSDWGSTADFFLLNGAKQVIAVDGYEVVIPRLFQNALKYPQIIPIDCFITSVKQLEDLYVKYRPDIVKSDMEGAEIFLTYLKDDVFQIPSYYMIEAHSRDYVQGLD